MVGGKDTRRTCRREGLSIQLFPRWAGNAVDLTWSSVAYVHCFFLRHEAFGLLLPFDGPDRDWSTCNEVRRAITSTFFR